MKTENTTPRTGREVTAAKAVSITCKGGFIYGKFVGFRTRTSKDNKPYSGWVIDAGGGLIESRDGGAVEKMEPGRAFVFGANRLDKVLQEVQAGENIRIDYLGKVANDKTATNPKGEGQHHTFKVVYLD